MKNTYFQNMDFPASRWHSRGQRFDPAYLHQGCEKGLFSYENKPFPFYKVAYRNDAGSFHRHLSIFPAKDGF